MTAEDPEPELRSLRRGQETEPKVGVRGKRSADRRDAPEASAKRAGGANENGRGSAQAEGLTVSIEVSIECGRGGLGSMHTPT